MFGPPQSRSTAELSAALADQIHVWVVHGDEAAERRSGDSLDAVLGAYLGAPPGPDAIVRAPGGKPRLAAGGPRFNLSHSAGLTLIAVAEGIEVGVDVERIRPRRDLVELARRAIGAGEAAAIAAAPASDREARFYAAWTRHEARLKCDGRGLDGGEPAAGIAVEGIEISPGWAAAVAVAAPEVPPLCEFVLHSEESVGA